MAVRSTMRELIARLRGLVGDPAGPEAAFDEEAMQTALDRRASDVRCVPLIPLETIGTDGEIGWHLYAAETAPWEAGEALQDGAWRSLVPETRDRWGGRWSFAASQPPPVFITGRVYDVMGAAADLLEAWAALRAGDYDFGAGGQAFRRSQAAVALRAQAAVYRRQQPAAAFRAPRDDVW